MENEVISIRLMQTRSLEHLWNRQKGEPELSFHEFTELLAARPVEVRFFRRDDDQATGRPQQRLVIRINGHTSIEMRCRTFVYQCKDGNSIKLFSIGGIREIISYDIDERNMIAATCNVRLLNWHTIGDVSNDSNIENELIESIGKMEVSYAIKGNADIHLVRQYLETRQRQGDQEVIDVIRAFNRIVNPEKYRST